MAQWLCNYMYDMLIEKRKCEKYNETLQWAEDYISDCIIKEYQITIHLDYFSIPRSQSISMPHQLSERSNFMHACKCRISNVRKYYKDDPILCLEECIISTIIESLSVGHKYYMRLLYVTLQSHHVPKTLWKF